MPRLPKSRSPLKPKKPLPIFTAEFRDKMYKNMWQFINPDVIKYIFNFKMSTKADINEENFTKKYENTICFKGTPKEGHYVFVGKDLKAYGTYERGLWCVSWCCNCVCIIFLETKS